MADKNGNRFKHGLAGTNFYRVWTNMKSRCNNPKATYYENYGGRGISVCEEWLDFDIFMKDMLKGYKKGLTLDRIDNEGSYCKSNCRWVSRKVQANNTRNTINAQNISYRGITDTVNGWAKRVGLNRTTLDNRIKVYGWDVVTAITTPTGKK